MEVCVGGVWYFGILLRKVITLVFLWQWNQDTRWQETRDLCHSILLCVCDTWTLFADSEEKIQAFETRCLGKLLCVSYFEHKINNWCGARSTSLWVIRNLLRQLSIDGNWHGLGMSRATAASPKPPFKAPEISGNAMVGSRNCRMDSIKMDISAHARTAHKGLQQESLEEDICWIVLHVPSMTQSVKGLNWTELNEIKTTKHTG